MTPFILVTIITALLTIQVNGYPSGAPTKLCTGSMVPHHKNISSQPLSTSPITKFETKWNSDGETITGKRLDLSLHLARRSLFSEPSQYWLQGTVERYLHPRSKTKWNGAHRHIHRSSSRHTSRSMSNCMYRTLEWSFVGWICNGSLVLARVMALHTVLVNNGNKWSWSGKSLARSKVKTPFSFGRMIASRDRLFSEKSHWWF